MLKSIPHAKLRRWLGPAALALVALVGTGAGLAIGSWQNLCQNCPSAAEIYTFEPKRATRVLSHDGRIIAELAEERRTPVSIETLPKYVPQAFIAVEDQRFYKHSGYSIRGFARAFIVRIPGVSWVLQRRAGGGSTITQQLARHMFEREIGFEQRPTRKLKELKVALQLEQVYSKDRILEAYINQVNYGRGHFGIESASRWMFGKPVYEIDPAEAALLAAVINLPEYYSPFRHPERARQRRNHVLRLMAQEGYLSQAESRRWQAAPLPAVEKTGPVVGVAPYFVEMIREQLDDQFGAELYSGGLRVFTTLDVGMQQRAQAAMESGWKRIEDTPGYRKPKYDPDADNAKPGYIQGMFIAADPETGAIRALIGGRNFRDSKFNRATQALRQPGSVFKPFVYATAIASGIPASTIMEDSPLFMEQADGTIWSPRNYDGEFRGPVSLRDALKFSINTVAVKLGLQVGMTNVAQLAAQMGLRTPIPPYPATAIGAAEVIPLQVVEAYSAFARSGIRARPFGVDRVEDFQGRVLWQSRPDTTHVLDPHVAAIVRDLMQEVVDHGSGYAARDPARGGLPYAIPAAGKTGTTNDATDVWFVGFTPDLIAAVWFGFDQPREIMPNAAGGVYGAPVWGEFMRSVYQGETPLRPAPAAWGLPDGVLSLNIDRTTGLRATPYCPIDAVHSELFIAGTEPKTACDIHATPFMPGRWLDTTRFQGYNR